MDLSEALDMDLNIYDLSGKLVHHQDLSLNQGFITVSIDVDHLMTGQYLLSLSSEKGVTISKLIVR